MVEVWKHVGTLTDGQGPRDSAHRGSVDYAKTACNRGKRIKLFVKNAE